MHPFRGSALDAKLVNEIERLTLDFLAGREPLFTDRIAAGRVIDGHSLSDADERIATAMAVRAEPWPDASTIHTDAAPAESVAHAAALVRRRPY
jgi:hypothetical protein